MLIALTSATRSSEVHCLDIDSMEKADEKITLHRFEVSIAHAFY